MAKRFTASEKWEDLWFSALPSKYKLFWIYILDKCDNAGVWEKNFGLAEYLIKDSFTEEEALTILKDKVIPFNDSKWFIPKFIEFQYGSLNEHSNPHKSVIDKLTKYGLFKNGVFKGINTHNESMGRVKDKDKNKDKAKDRGKCLFSNSIFLDKETFRTSFISNPDYAKYDWEHYYEAVKNWSASNNQMKTDWIATVYGWARKDGDKHIIKNVIKLPSR